MTIGKYFEIWQPWVKLSSAAAGMTHCQYEAIIQQEAKYEYDMTRHNKASYAAMLVGHSMAHCVTHSQKPPEIPTVCSGQKGNSSVSSSFMCPWS